MLGWIANPPPIGEGAAHMAARKKFVRDAFASAPFALAVRLMDDRGSRRERAKALPQLLKPGRRFEADDCAAGPPVRSYISVWTVPFAYSAPAMRRPKATLRGWARLPTVQNSEKRLRECREA